LISSFLPVFAILLAGISSRIWQQHRLSTLRSADRIVSMENGKVIEDGSYEDLLEKGGR